MRDWILIVLLGLVAGALLGYGMAAVRFDLTHLGLHTTVWDVLIGGVMPVFVLVIASRRLRGDSDRRRKWLAFFLALVLGVVVGYVALMPRI